MFSIDQSAHACAVTRAHVCFEQFFYCWVLVTMPEAIFCECNVTLHVLLVLIQLTFISVALDAYMYL